MSIKKADYISNISKKKIANNKTIDKYLAIENEKKANALAFCFNKFYAEKYKHKTNELEKFKSRPLTTCKNKFCHICSYIKSKKTFVKTYQAIEDMRNDNIDFIAYHLTLTIKNPYTFDLESAYNTMNKAFHNFMKNFKPLNEYLVGWQVGREISQSAQARNNNEFHPHLHCLLLLKPEFYNPTNRTQKITKAEFRNRWKKSCEHYNIEAYQIEFKKIKARADYVNIEVDDGEIDPFLSAISEVAKYPTKPADIQKMSVEHFEILDRVMHGKRQTSTGGLLKKYIGFNSDNEILHINNWELVEVLFCEYNKRYSVKTLDSEEFNNYVINKEQDIKEYNENVWKKLVE